MTEKRFYIEDEHIKDNLEAHNPLYVETYNEAKRFCDLLNALSDENEQLKKEIKHKDEIIEMYYKLMEFKE